MLPRLPDSTGGDARRTEKGAHPRDAIGDLEGPITALDDNAPDAHGNTVDLVEEMTEMTKDNLLTDAMVSAYNYKVTALRTAIRGQ